MNQRNRKLTPTQVRYIRTHPGAKPVDLAKRYGVCLATIYNVRARRSWKGVSSCPEA